MQVIQGTFPQWLLPKNISHYCRSGLSRDVSWKNGQLLLLLLSQKHLKILLPFPHCSGCLVLLTFFLQLLGRCEVEHSDTEKWYKSGSQNVLRRKDRKSGQKYWQPPQLILQWVLIIHEFAICRFDSTWIKKPTLEYLRRLPVRHVLLTWELAAGKCCAKWHRSGRGWWEGSWRLGGALLGWGSWTGSGPEGRWDRLYDYT